MFKIGESVSYGVHGVCRISDIKTQNFCGEEKKYYILKPVYGDTSVIYVPTDNKVLTDKMKKVLSAEEIYKLIEIMPELQTNWIDNDRERNEKYSLILKGNDCTKIISLIRTLYFKKNELENAGKKFRAQDKKLLDISEKVLHEEFAQALNISPNEVVSFIKSHIKEKLQE